MNWFLTAGVCVVLVEIALRLPFRKVVTKISYASVKATRVIRSKTISDHWKEKALAAYARTTFSGSLKLAGLLLVLFGVAAALIMALDLVAAGLQAFILSWRGIGLSILFASLYVTARKSIVNDDL